MAWIYESVVHNEVEEVGQCIYCKSALDHGDVSLDGDEHLAERYDNGLRHFLGGQKTAYVCPSCGWWYVNAQYDGSGGVHVHFYMAYGQLKSLDLTDITTPIDELRRYLTAKYKSRFAVDPSLYEETVASVFRDIGYEALVTARSGDWGIDVYLGGADNSQIGVQVKRWKNAINVEQITALTGALVINNCARGIFVTTSRFRRGAIEAASRSARFGYPVELIDAKRFYDILKIAQARHKIELKDPLMPWNKITPQHKTGIF